MIIQSLGLELRRIGTLGELYKEVDAVLDNAKNVQMQTVAHGIQKMFKPDKYLDVCFIKTAMQICNIVIPEERMLIYSAIHCMHWDEMTQDYRRLIMAMVLDDFRGIFVKEGVAV